MVHHITVTGLLLTLGIVFSKFVWPIISLYLRRRQARIQNGCEEPVQYPHTERLRGSDLLQLRKEALKDGRLKMLYLEHHRQLGETWQEITAEGGIRINMISPPNLRHVHALQSSSFTKPTSNADVMRLVGIGLLTTEGKAWARNRKVVEPTFSKYETATMPMLKMHVDRFMANLPMEGQGFDAQPLLKRLFLDSATEFLFGESLGMQLPEKQKEAEEFLATLDSALLGMNKRRQDFSWTSVKLRFDSSYAADVAKVHRCLDVWVAAALARTEPMSNQNKGERSSTNGRYILVDELARQIRDPVHLRSAMIQCFLPARDQPAILLTNALFQLARHPQHWTKLRQVALGVPEDEQTSFRRLSSLKPIRNVILESVRLCGPGGLHKRRAARDVILPEGGGQDGKSPLFVPEGTDVCIHAPVAHRNKKYWGEDADEFRPERFEGGTPEGFFPFLHGPRTCPAKDQTMVQMTYVLVRMLKSFESIENKDEVFQFVEMARLTTESRRGARIALKPSEG